MGMIFSRASRVRKVVFLGLSSSGKSTIISVLEAEYSRRKADEVVPTKGFKATSVKRGGKSIAIWELGGDEGTIPFWKCYFANTRGVVFVIDGADASNKHESVGLLCDVCREKSLEHAAILILVHKSDREVNVGEITKNGIHIFGKRKFKAFPTSVEQKSSIISAFDWLVGAMR